MTEETAEEAVWRRRVSAAALLIALVMVAMVFVVFIVNFVVALGFNNTAYFRDVLKDRLAAFLGLPQTSAVTFAVVVLLRQTEGPFTFKAFGIEASGASGQVVMWVFAFVAMTGMMHLVW